MSDLEPFFTKYVRGFTFEYWRTSDGGQFVTCRRDDSGICGDGATDVAAEADFMAKQEELLPLPKPSYVVHSSPFEPPSYGDNPAFREDD